MNQKYDRRQLFNVRNVILLVTFGNWISHCLAVVVIATVIATSGTTGIATDFTSAAFLATKLSNTRMSFSRSKQPLLSFQRTTVGARVSKLDAVTARCVTSVSHSSVRPHTHDEFFHRRIKSRKPPAFLNHRQFGCENAFQRVHRERGDVQLWLSTMESDKSQSQSQSSRADSNCSVGSKIKGTVTTTNIHNASTTRSIDDNLDERNESESEKTLTSKWNIVGLKKETYRRLDRAQKKVDQCNSRIERFKAKKDEPPVNSNPHLPSDLRVLEAELVHASDALNDLRRFETLLLPLVKSDNVSLVMVLPEHVAVLALALNMTDHPPKRPPRGETKPKGPRKVEPTRKPYRKYTSVDNIEIRVGKKAEDNDELSTNPQYRDNDDWWMHAAGCPGSHVIIRFSDRKQDPPHTTVQDAAMLAAKNSKCNGNVIKVNMCRARDIKKPPFSKPGLVMITGNVRTVSVDMKASQKRLERLESTVEVN